MELCNDGAVFLCDTSASRVGTKRDIRIACLSEHLGFAHTNGATILQEEVPKNKHSEYPWMGYGIQKGVTDPYCKRSILGKPPCVADSDLSGLHAELLIGYPEVDSFPLCYDNERHVHGFGPWVRWVYLSDPLGHSDRLGVDFSIVLRPTAGVCDTVIKVSDTIRVLVEHGLSQAIEIVLLNHRMGEPDVFTEIREELGLRYAHQWMGARVTHFGAHGSFCPRCGLHTRKEGDKFCSFCSANIREVMDMAWKAGMPSPVHDAGEGAYRGRQQVAASPEERASVSGNKFCTECGQEFKSDDKFCGGCGTRR